MILAGGLSTRLYPLTKQVPKPLVPVALEPNTVHLIRYLQSYGYNEIAINVHYLADAIVAALGDGSRYGVKLEYVHEKELLGSAGAVKQMESFFGNQTFVVVGCDDLTNLRLDELVAFHRQRRAIATIGLVEFENVSQLGVVVTGENGKVVDFQEKPAPGTERSHWVNTGIYVFEPGIFHHIPSSEFYDFGKQVFPELQIAGAEFYGFAAPDAYWCDIGTPHEYRRATRDLLSGAFTIPGARSRGIDPSAKVASGAVLEGAILVGRDVVIGHGCYVTGPTVIGNGVRIGMASRIESSILWDGVTVGAGAYVGGSILGVGYDVPPASSLDCVIVANEDAARE
jgi:NDP-sugar pyrophosphorylase family protein